jgi:adenine/guanine phosphoribosyltransferase-like PRPP-binding protein
MSNLNRAVLDKIAARVRDSRRINYGTYSYFVWPYKGISPIDPEELRTLVLAMEQQLPPGSDLLFTFQSDGEILAIPLAWKLRRPLMVCRDTDYQMQDPLVITQHTRYWTRNLYCEKLAPHSQVVLVEAIISTGNTVIEAVRKIRSCKADVVGVVTVVSKVNYQGEQRIKQETGIDSTVLLRVAESPDNKSLTTEWLV